MLRPRARDLGFGDSRARDLAARLEAFHVAVRVGRAAQAVEADPSLVADADALGDDRLAVEARREVALALGHLGRADEALELQREAIEGAARCGCDFVSARIWIDLLNVTAIDAGRPRDAIVQEVAAAAAVARVGSPPSMVGELESARGVSRLFTGDYDEAETAFNRALGLLVGQSMTLSALSNLAAIQLMRGEYGAAEESYGRVVAIESEEVGPDHPRTVDDRGNLALARLYAGEFEAAEAGLREAIAGLEAAQGADAYRVARAWPKLAYAQLVQGKVDEAARTIEKGVRSLKGSVGEQFEYAVAISQRAAIEGVQGNDAAADRDFREALALVSELAGSEGPNYAALVTDRARFLVARARGAEIEDDLRRALEVLRGVAPHHPTLAAGLTDLGEIRLRAGDVDEATRVLQEAVEVAEAGETWPPERARAELALAVALTAAGRDPPRASRLAEAAAATFAAWPDYPWSRAEAAAAFLKDPEATVAGWTGTP